MQQTRRFLMPTVTMLLLFGPAAQGADSPFPGERGKDLDTACRPDIWEKQSNAFLAQFVKVPRCAMVSVMHCCLPRLHWLR
jgi:hypothetical protein